MKTIITTAILGIFLSLSVQGQGLKTKSVSLFKNGTAFTIKEGNVKTKDGIYHFTDSIPNPLFGTFWIFSPNNQLKSVSSFIDKIERSHKSLDVLTMLRGNEGKRARLYLQQVDKKVESIEGTIEEIRGNLIIIHTGGTWVSLSPNQITRVDYLERPNDNVVSKIKGRILEIEFLNKNANQPLEMMYMQNSLSWLPNYLVELSSDKENEATLTLRAVVMNDGEDLENVEMNFIVGTPNFMYTHMLSPMMSSTAVATFLAQLGNQYAQLRSRGGHALSNTIATQSMGYSINEESSDFLPNGEVGSLEGSAEEDLFFYNKKNVNLKKGARAFYDILRAEVPIQHIYEGNLTANSMNQGYYQQEFSFNEASKNKIWHSIKITNNSKSPLTTGTAMVVRRDGDLRKPISQDRIKYTPIKGESFLKLTESLDIKIRDSEKEIKRVQRAKTRHRTHYDLVTVEGQIKLKNYKDKKVDLNVRRSITGMLLESNIDWLKVTRVYTAYHGLNSQNQVCWETSLKPGEEKLIKYSYEVYIYSGY